MAGLAGGEPESEAPGSGGKKKSATASSCPDWVVAAYGSTAGGSVSASALRCTRHGEPEAVSLGVVSRDSRQATLELRTGGFYALHEASGKVRVFVAGFDSPQDPQAPALPFRRALVDGGGRTPCAARRGARARAGGLPRPRARRARQGRDAGLAGRDGARRPPRARGSPRRSTCRWISRGCCRASSRARRRARSSSSTPLRYDARRQQIVLAKRLLVKLLFTGRETGESGRGNLGRRREAGEADRRRAAGAAVHDGPRALRGLLRAALPGPGGGSRVVAAAARAAGTGAGLPHRSPTRVRSAPGSVLYFHADTAASSTDFSSETAWELRARG